MLCEAFTVNTLRARAPRDTNGVESVNQASNDSSTPGLLKAMENLCKKDKVVGLSYISAEKCITITYRDQYLLMMISQSLDHLTSARTLEISKVSNPKLKLANEWK